MLPKNNLKLVSLDGGGIRGFSQLEILRNTMHRLTWDIQSDGSDIRTLPCEHFDIIGGSGTGGLIAIFLTKLRMSVEEASDEFCTITEEVYKQDGLTPSERSDRLRRCMEDVLTRRGFPIHMKLMDEIRTDGCAGFVVVSLRSNIETKVCLRTYPIRSQPSSNITVIEAVLASCATHPEFASVTSGERYRKREYVGAGFGANNPVREVIREAHSLFGGSSTVASLLSLGTGHPGIISWPLNGNNLDVFKVMRDMMNDCEQRAQEMEERMRRVGIYSRFSVEQGMQNGYPGQAADPGWITTQTESYLNGCQVCNKLDSFVRNASAKTGFVTLNQLEHADGSDEPSQLAVSIEKSLGILISNQDDAIIEKLKPADLDCSSHIPECLQGTRQDILASIDAWVMDSNAPNILWINGYPGVGKSAIATSIVEKWRSSGRLGSSFFFRRDEADVMTPYSLWRTVAYDLGRRYSAIRKHLVAVLVENCTLPTTPNIDKLFRELVQNPLVASSDILTQRPPVIVIDALDECGGLDGHYSDHRKSLMRALKSWSSLPRKFKLVVTSRRESDIKQLFLETSHQPLSILAGRGTSSQSSQDIQTLLRHELRLIVSQHPLMPPDWPGEEIIWTLTGLASGLFIWVKTVLKILERGELERMLKQILNGTGGMASLYKSILDTSFPSPSKEDIDDFRSVLGAIIFAKTPLDMPSLAHLLSISNSAISYICNGLHSVLEHGESLRIHHESFVDFLLDPEECPASFLIDQQRENQTLTRGCLHIMKKHLRFNICDLGSSYVRNQDVPGLASRVKARISSYLAYSSCHWAGHLTESGFDGEVYEALEYFMRNQFLFWLEVLSLVKQVNLGSSMLRLLIGWMKNFGQDETLAMDMHKFVVAFASVIAQSVPHIYVSALPFAPRRLAVSRHYMASYPQTLRVRRGGYMSWPAIQNVFNGHNSWVQSVSFSPDGTRIASGSGDNTIRIWNADTGETVMEPLQGHTDSVNSISFSPNGTCIASGSSDNTIRVWDAETGETVLGPLDGHTYSVNSISFSQDGTRIASGSSDGTIRVWDVKTGKTVMGPLEGHTYPVNSVSFSPDGTRIVSGSDDGTIRVWDAKTSKTVMGPLEGHMDSINSVSFSPDGIHIASGSSDGSIRVCNAKTGETVMGPLEGHTDSVSSISFSPNGTRIVSGSHDNTIRVWDAKTGETVMGPLKGHISLVDSVSFSPDGTRIVSGSDDGTIRVWDAEIGKPIMGSLDDHADWVHSISFSPDNTHVISGSDDSIDSNDNIIRGWDAETCPTVIRLSGDDVSPITSFSLSPDGTRAVSGSSDNTIRVWDAETGELVIGPLEGHTNSVNSVSFSPDGTRIVSGSDDSTLRVWDAGTGETTIWPLEGHTDSVSSASFSPNGICIVSGSSDTTIRVWDADTGETVIGPLEGHTHSVNSVSYSPDGTRIVSGSFDNTIRIWDAETGKRVLGPLEGHISLVESVSFSLDCTRIVSGSWDYTIRIWDAETGETMVGPLEGHTDWVTSVSFSPDGTRIVSGSSDNTIRIWDAKTGETVVGPLEGHTSSVNFVSFSSDGTRIVSGSDDDTIRVWNAEMGKTVTGQLEDEFDWVYSVSFSPDGTRIVSGSDDNIIRVWDVETGEIVIGPLGGHTDLVTSVSFSPDGTCIVSGSSDNTIRVWDAETGGTVIGPLEGHTDSVNSVLFSPDGLRIVSGSDDSTIRMWNAETGETEMRPLEGHTHSVNSVSFSPDGTRISSGSSDGTIRVWDVETGETVIGPLEGHTDLVTSVSFSPDGTRIISGSFDNTIRIWDAETGKTTMRPLEGHISLVNSVSFSPDGTRIVSGSWDYTIRIWDAKTGEIVMGPLGGHTDWVTSVSFSPDGRRIVSGSNDNTIRIWDVEIDEKVMGSSENHTELVNPVSFSLDGKHVVSDLHASMKHLRRLREEYSTVHIYSLFRESPQTEDGWILGPKSELLFWVPPGIRSGLCSLRNTLVLRGDVTQLDLANFVHGDAWSHCRDHFI